MTTRIGSIGRDATRFGIAGIVNTALSLGVYQLALFVVSPSQAYALAWLAGIAFLIVVYPSRVFVGGRSGWRDRVLLASSYVVVFLLGLVFLRGFIAVLGAERLAIVATIGFTTVLNFLASRLVLRRRIT